MNELKLHPRVEERVKEINDWVDRVKEQSPICYTLEDKIKPELEKIEGFISLSYIIYIGRPEVFLHVNHVKSITDILRVFHKHFGKIIRRSVKPSDKKFNFNFDKVEVVFSLTGDSCKLVKTGEKPVDVFELRCNNGEGTVIDEDYIKEGQK